MASHAKPLGVVLSARLGSWARSRTKTRWLDASLRMVFCILLLEVTRGFVMDHFFLLDVMLIRVWLDVEMPLAEVEERSV